MILALQLLLSWWIRRTKLGMGLVAIREDEAKAATIGINLPVEKMIGFARARPRRHGRWRCYGYYLTFIDPRGHVRHPAQRRRSILSLLVGGKATLWGPVLGAFIDRAAQRGGQQRLRRRQRPAVALRRSARRSW